jgi:anti-sigma-K factor RskA
MSHPTDLLAEYILGGLEPQEQQELEAHLQSCASCRAELATLNKTLVAMVESLPAPEVPANNWQGIQQKLRPSLSPAARRWRWESWALAASLVLALAGLWWGFRQNQLVQTLRAENTIVSRWLARSDVRVMALPQVEGQTFGSVILLPDGRALFVLKELPAKNQTYQAWGYINDDEVSLGITSGHLLEISYTGYEELAMSLEPYGGNDWSTGMPERVSVVEKHDY